MVIWDFVRTRFQPRSRAHECSLGYLGLTWILSSQDTYLRCFHIPRKPPVSKRSYVMTPCLLVLLLLPFSLAVVNCCIQFVLVVVYCSPHGGETKSYVVGYGGGGKLEIRIRLRGGFRV